MSSEWQTSGKRSVERWQWYYVDIIVIKALCFNVVGSIWNSYLFKKIRTFYSSMELHIEIKCCFLPFSSLWGWQVEGEKGLLDSLNVTLHPTGVSWGMIMARSMGGFPWMSFSWSVFWSFFLGPAHPAPSQAGGLIWNLCGRVWIDEAVNSWITVTCWVTPPQLSHR